MLAGRVATLVMRLAQLWTDFQQTGISVQRLGDSLNARDAHRDEIRSQCDDLCRPYPAVPPTHPMFSKGLILARELLYFLRVGVLHVANDFEWRLSA